MIKNIVNMELLEIKSEIIKSPYTKSYEHETEYISKDRAIEIIDKHMRPITKNEAIRFFNDVFPLLGKTSIVSYIFVPDNATNGDVIKIAFPNIEISKGEYGYDLGDICTFDIDWWNTPYGESEE